MYTYVDRDGFETGRTALNQASGCKSVGNIYNTWKVAYCWINVIILLPALSFIAIYL